MPIDREFLRQHYAAMADEELLSIDRDDLVEAAREIYDEEVKQRSLAEPEGEVAREGPSAADVENPIDWLEDAAEAFSVLSRPGTRAEEIETALTVLEEDGIPTHVEVVEEPGDEQPVERIRVLVPGKLIHRAASVLDRDIFNEQFVSAWRHHLEVLSDDELRIMEPRYAFCGLYDRLERINRAYGEELDRRRLRK